MTFTTVPTRTRTNKVAPMRTWRRSRERGRRSWLALRVLAALLFGLLTAATAYGVSATAQPVTYRATAVVVAAPSAARVDNEALLRTLAALATSPPVLQAASTQGRLLFDGAELAAKVSVSRPPDSSVLNISSEDRSRAVSLEIATSVAAALVQNAARLGNGDETAAARIRVVTLGSATATRIDPPLLRNSVIGGGLGLLVAATALLVLGRNEERIGSAGELTVSGDDLLEIPSQHPRDAATVFDLVHRALVLGEQPDLRRIAVVGGSSREETSFMLMLSVVLASVGKRVLLIDADLGARTLTSRLRQAGQPGFAEVLTDEITDATALQVPLPADRLPRWMRNLLPPDAADITFLPAGRSDVQPGLLNSATAAASTHSLGDIDVTVVVTPRVPGLYPVTSLLRSADAIFVLAVPRWTRLAEGRWRVHLVRKLAGRARVTIAVLGEQGPEVEDGSPGRR
jgi:capsular polysaccharide biosynthesis protein/Mrp family chromosome partitioning ATPase